MAVTAAMIKELREITGAGMSDCKNALVASEGDIEKAVDALREKGLAAAAKKAGRLASEGLVFAYIDETGKNGVVVEVNSETDFVAKNQDFKNYVEQVAQQAVASTSTDMEGFFEEKWKFDETLTVKEALSHKIAIIGENLNIRRFEKFQVEGNGVLISYIHGGGKVAVMIKFVSEVVNDALAEAGKNVCMQIAAMNPRFISRDDVPAEFIEKEKEILTQQALNEGKAPNVVEKMIVGRLNKELKDLCLLEQEYVKDNEVTIGKYLEAVGKEIGAVVTVSKFERYETGEGLQKREENFAEEVSKQLNG